MKRLVSRSVLPALRAFACVVASVAAAAALAAEARLGNTVVRFASVAEGRAALASNDAWIEATSDFQRAVTTGLTPPVSAERMREFVASTVQPWRAEQEARWLRALDAIAPRLAALRVPLPAEILLVDTDGRDAAGAPYTRGRAIVLPSASLGEGGGAGDAMLLAHELFHVVSRHDPELATRLYRTIGFEPVAPLQWPSAWLAQRIANPDAPFDRHAMRVTLAGRETWVMPVLVARRTDLRPGETFFSVMDVRLLEVVVGAGPTQPVLREGTPVWHPPQQVPDYLARLGGNTGYIIHPEETMADNFALLVTGRPVPNAALLARIEAVLTNGR